MGTSVPDLAWERRLGGVVCGVDEVGRGPLAGPVVTAAVILDPRNLPRELDGLDDSKRLDAAARRHYVAVLRRCARIGIGAASVAEIDRLNILQASLLAMARAVAALGRGARRGAGRRQQGAEARLPGGDADRRRRPVAVDRRGLRRGQGDARPGDGEPVAPALPLWLGAQCRLPDRGAPSGDPAARRHRHHRRSFAPVRAALAAIAGA